MDWGNPKNPEYVELIIKMFALKCMCIKKVTVSLEAVYQNFEYDDTCTSQF